MDHLEVLTYSEVVLECLEELEVPVCLEELGDLAYSVGVLAYSVEALAYLAVVVRACSVVVLAYLVVLQACLALVVLKVEGPGKEGHA